MTEPEFMRACNAHWSAHHHSTASNLVISATAIILGSALLLFTFWLALILAIAGGMLLFLTWFRYFVWRRAFRESKRFNDDIAIAVDNESIHIESAEGKSDLKWGFYTWYLDTPEHVLLYMTKRSFSVIPKSAFKDEQHTQGFVDLVRSKLKRIK